MAKKSSVSSRQERQRPVKSGDITLDDKARAELAALRDLPVDVTDPDAPEITDWSDAVVGKFYRPIKKQVTLRLDADLLEWFRAQDGKYQTLINQALREYMKSHR